MDWAMEGNAVDGSDCDWERMDDMRKIKWLPKYERQRSPGGTQQEYERKRKHYGCPGRG